MLKARPKPPSLQDSWHAKFVLQRGRKLRCRGRKASNQLVSSMPVTPATPATAAAPCMATTFGSTIYEMFLVLVFAISSYRELPILSLQAHSRASVFLHCQLWYPKNGPDARSSFSWAFPDSWCVSFSRSMDDVPFHANSSDVDSDLPILLSWPFPIYFPTQSQPLPERASLGPPRWNVGAEFRRFWPWFKTFEKSWDEWWIWWCNLQPQSLIQQIHAQLKI